MNRTKWIAGAVLLPAMVALSGIGVAADSNPDADFYKKAGEGGLSEVELGKIAQAKSANAAVKQFAAMMVRDHSKANDKLKSVAASQNVSLPTSSSVGQMATKAKLEVLSGDTFDKSYIKGMIADHKEDIAEFQKEASSGQDPAAKAFAKATLPTLQKHLKHVQAIAPQVGVDL